MARAQYIFLEEQCDGICNDTFVILEFILLLYQKLLENHLEIHMTLLLKSQSLFYKKQPFPWP